MMTEPDEEPAVDLGDLEAFQGVAKFPVRVKCATLAWHVLEEDHVKARRRGLKMPKNATITPDEIMEKLRPIQDPEIHLGIVDLGLIYDVHIDDDDIVDVT